MAAKAQLVLLLIFGQHLKVGAHAGCFFFRQEHGHVGEVSRSRVLVLDQRIDLRLQALLAHQLLLLQLTLSTDVGNRCADLEAAQSSLERTLDVE